MFIVRLPSPECFFFGGGGCLAAFGDQSVIRLSWAGMWAEHDSMTFAGFDNGERAHIFIVILFWILENCLLPGCSACTTLRPQGGTLNASSPQSLSVAVRFVGREAAVGEIVSLNWHRTT